MAKQRINMITLMNTAWARRQQCSANQYEEYVKNLITHSFVEYERMYKSYCVDKGIKYEDQVFYVYQHIFVFLMKCDGEFLQGEYDAYCKYCNWAKIQPLTVDAVNRVYANMSVEQIAADIRLLTGLREFITPQNYESMVQGFCYFSLLGDKSFDENEYYIIKCFFEDGYDYVPATWDRFKKEWT